MYLTPDADPTAGTGAGTQQPQTRSLLSGVRSVYDRLGAQTRAGTVTPTTTAPPTAVPTTLPAPTMQPPVAAPTTLPAPTQAQPQVQAPVDPNSLQGLRGQAILPGQQPFQQIPGQASEGTQSLMGALQGQLMGLNNLPDRQALAQEQLALFNEQQAPLLQQRIQDIGRGAAKFGRIGSGVTTSQVGDAFTQAEQQRAQMERQLANETAGLQMQDRMGALNALMGGTGQLFGMDQSLRGEQRGERDAELQAGLLGRQELRGERDYGNNLANQALQTQIQQRLMEEDLLNREFGRNMSQAGAAGSFGFGYDPTGTFMGGADRESELARALFGAGAGAFGQIGQNQGYQQDILSQLLGMGGNLLGGGGAAPSPVGGVSPSGSTVGGALDPNRLFEMLMGGQ